MSLSLLQKKKTIHEFKENFELCERTLSEIAKDLHTTPTYIEQVMNLQSTQLEDPWILRNYLLKHIRYLDKDPVLFTALSGDHHDYWFLDSTKIDKGTLL